jgi:hypothetical protein
MDKNRFLVDYYLTKKADVAKVIENISLDSERYDIVEKVKMNAYASDGTELGDNIDVFIPKNNFPKGKTPRKHDMVFFTNEKRFYTALGFEDGGEFFIISVNKCKQF